MVTSGGLTAIAAALLVLAALTYAWVAVVAVLRLVQFGAAER